MENKIRDYWVGVHADGSVSVKCIWDRNNPESYNGFGEEFPAPAEDGGCDVACTTEECRQKGCPCHPDYEPNAIIF